MRDNNGGVWTTLTDCLPVGALDRYESVEDFPANPITKYRKKEHRKGKIIWAYTSQYLAAKYEAIFLTNGHQKSTTLRDLSLDKII